jgi:hypothetical protein
VIKVNVKLNLLVLSQKGQGPKKGQRNPEYASFKAHEKTTLLFKDTTKALIWKILDKVVQRFF